MALDFNREEPRFFLTANYANFFVLMSLCLETAKQREAGGILDREATRRIFLNRELRECGRINSIIRKFVITIVTTANGANFYVLMSLCSYVLTTANGASGGATKPHP